MHVCLYDVKKTNCHIPNADQYLPVYLCAQLGCDVRVYRIQLNGAGLLLMHLPTRKAW